MICGSSIDRPMPLVACSLMRFSAMSAARSRFLLRSLSTDVRAAEPGACPTEAGEAVERRRFAGEGAPDDVAGGA